MILTHAVYRVHKEYAVKVFASEILVDDTAYAADADSRLDDVAKVAAVAGGVWLQMLLQGSDVLVARVTMRDKGATYLSAGQDIIAASPCAAMVKQLIDEINDDRRPTLRRKDEKE